LSLDGNRTTDLNVALTQKLSTGEITVVQLPVVTIDGAGRRTEIDASFLGFAIAKRRKPITVDGNLDDWKCAPAIAVTNTCLYKPKFAKDAEPVGYPGDFAAKFQAVWDADSLYLAVRIIDDEFVAEDRGKLSGQWYNDTTKGFDTNDYNYDFYPDPKNNRAVAFRRFAPEQQLAGGLVAPKPMEAEPNIITAFRRVRDGYLYEIAIPKRYIAPMKLEAESSVGFAIFINDRDGKRVKNALTMTPPGTGGYMNPHLYPVMLVVK